MYPELANSDTKPLCCRAIARYHARTRSGTLLSPPPVRCLPSSDSTYVRRFDYWTEIRLVFIGFYAVEHMRVPVSKRMLTSMVLFGGVLVAGAVIGLAAPELLASSSGQPVSSGVQPQLPPVQQSLPAESPPVDPTPAESTPTTDRESATTTQQPSVTAPLPTRTTTTRTSQAPPTANPNFTPNVAHRPSTSRRYEDDDEHEFGEDHDGYEHDDD